MSTSPSSLRLDPLWGDGMVLQREQPNRLGGWDGPAQRLSITFRGTIHRVTTEASGRWDILIPSGSAGGPFDLVVEGSTRKFLRDVYVGEVWLCSGQSNMEWRLNQCPQARQDMTTAQHPAVHFCLVPNQTSDQPQEELPLRWHTLSPATAPQLSAVAFYFARRLHNELKVPVGLIISAWGGTPAETWVPAPAFEFTATTRRLMNEFQQAAEHLEERAQADAARIAAWEATHLPADPGNTGLANGWAGADFEDGAWPVMSVPGFWQTHPGLNFNGVVWFRRTLILPPTWQGQELELHLGAIDDFDDTYVNGERVGGLGREIPDAFQRPRVYQLPPHLTRGERLVVAIRIFDHFGLGGFRALPDEMRLIKPGADEPHIPLHGDWHLQVEHRLPALPPDLFSNRPWMSPGLLPQDRPAHAYNAMIHPLRRWSLQGVLWYQGESNSGRAGDYTDLLQSLIEGWRHAFAQPSLFFLIVQLPNYSGGGDWALIREAQTRALAWPATALAVTLDVGDTVDIHPLRKQPVGERLAGLALHDVYNVPVPARGPELCTWKRSGPRLALMFHHAEGGLSTADGRPAQGFEVCGPDGIYHAVTGHPTGVWVELEHPGQAVIHGVRYAFSADPAVNLINRSGLPAAPFRRDPPALETAPPLVADA